MLSVHSFTWLGSAHGQPFGKVSEMLSCTLGETVPCSANVLLLNDSSSLPFSVKQTRIWLAGIKAAKRLIACRWINPPSMTLQRWFLDFLDLANMEHWVAQMHQAKKDNIIIWKQAVIAVRCHLQLLSGSVGPDW